MKKTNQYVTNTVRSFEKLPVYQASRSCTSGLYASAGDVCVLGTVSALPSRSVILVSFTDAELVLLRRTKYKAALPLPSHGHPLQNMVNHQKHTDTPLTVVHIDLHKVGCWRSVFIIAV